jgi:hypothetical protein
MRRSDLTEATLHGWARLDAAQRQRFFEAFLKAALRSPNRSIRPASYFLYLRMPTLPASCERRAKRRAKLPPGRTGARPMAARTRRQTLPPYLSPSVLS